MEYVNKSLSVVVLGSHNPAILSHDFLIDNGLIDKDAEMPIPLITPAVSRLEYKNQKLIITVIPEKMQIEQEIENAEDSTIIQFTKRFYEILEYTPINSFGINFHGSINFTDKDEYEKFERIFVVSKQRFIEIFNSSTISIGSDIIYFYHDFRCTMKILPVISEPVSCPIRLNCHLDNKSKQRSQKESGFINNIAYHVELYRHFYHAIIELVRGESQ